MSKFARPDHIKDTGLAHVQFGDDPKPNLQKYGYCVVENVYTKQECAYTINKMWHFLENIGTGISRSDLTTWTNDRWPPHLHQGMLHHSIAHEEFIWENREHKNLVHLFSQIFGTDKLLTSFDGVCIGRPPHLDTKDMVSSWLHTDQNIVPSWIPTDEVYNSDYYCIQGVVNYEDAGDDDASLFVGEGTHVMHSELFQMNGKEPKENWFVLDKDDVVWLIKEKRAQFVKVNAPAGSVILFDTRAFHQGYPGVSHKNNSRFRYVQYVSMTPEIRTTKKDLALKLESIEKGLVTSHFSSNNIKVFPLPASYDKVFEKLFLSNRAPNHSKWSERRKQLAGLLSYDD